MEKIVRRRFRQRWCRFCTFFPVYGIKFQREMNQLMPNCARKGTNFKPSLPKSYGENLFSASQMIQDWAAEHDQLWYRATNSRLFELTYRSVTPTFQTNKVIYKKNARPNAKTVLYYRERTYCGSFLFHEFSEHYSVLAYSVVWAPWSMLTLWWCAGAAYFNTHQQPTTNIHHTNPHTLQPARPHNTEQHPPPLLTPPPPPRPRRDPLDAAVPHPSRLLSLCSGLPSPLPPSYLTPPVRNRRPTCGRTLFDVFIMQAKNGLGGVLVLA